VLIVLAIASGGIFSLRFAGGAVAMLFPAVLVFLVTCLLTGIPAAGVIWLGEKLQMRSMFYFGFAGAVIGGLSENLLAPALVSQPQPPIAGLPFVVAGLAAGLAYWSVAGKHADQPQSVDRTHC
jgi:hypothetical protein